MSITHHWTLLPSHFDFYAICFGFECFNNLISNREAWSIMSSADFTMKSLRANDLAYIYDNFTNPWWWGKNEWMTTDLSAHLSTSVLFFFFFFFHFDINGILLENFIWIQPFLAATDAWTIVNLLFNDFLKNIRQVIGDNRKAHHFQPKNCVYRYLSMKPYCRLFGINNHRIFRLNKINGNTLNNDYYCETDKTLWIWHNRITRCHIFFPNEL